jgi:hypothetical protein
MNTRILKVILLVTIISATLSLTIIIALKGDKQLPPDPINKEVVNPLVIKRLMHEVEHGLTEVKLNDSTTILIYRGVESCTMLQLK